MSSDSRYRVLAVGAAGVYAGLVVPELAKRGAIVRGLIQHPEQEASVRRAGASEVVFGDLSKPADVEAAVKGMDAIFYIAPAFIENEPAIGVGMVNAAKRVGVRRIVFSSVIDPILSALENHSAKAPVEEAILESNMEYTLLHPTLFFQISPGAGRRFTSPASTESLGRSSRASLASITVTSPKWPRSR